MPEFEIAPKSYVGIGKLYALVRSVCALLYRIRCGFVEFVLMCRLPTATGRILGGGGVWVQRTTSLLLTCLYFQIPMSIGYKNLYGNRRLPGNTSVQTTIAAEVPIRRVVTIGIPWSIQEKQYRMPLFLFICVGFAISVGGSCVRCLSSTQREIARLHVVTNLRFDLIDVRFSSTDRINYRDQYPVGKVVYLFPIGIYCLYA